ncbi:outer membrane beta-barrel protein [Thiohalorhabdus sp.]|uniref:outer membrane beta-barrel protein n=1 Tax=Thiohalorhabdus sp. TaxID=3094134 RepID=UPI002FC2AE79
MRIRSAFGALTVLVPAMLNGPALAAEKPVYLGGGVAVQSIPGGEDGTAAVFRGGAKLDEVLPGLGMEGELTRSLVDPEAGGGRDVTFTSFAGYGVYTAPLPDRRVALRGRLGLALVDEDPEGRSSDSDLEVSWGLGGKLRITSTVSAFVDYTRLSASLDHLTLGALARF